MAAKEMTDYHFGWKYWLLQHAKLANVLAAVSVILVWSCWPALRAMMAAMRLEPIKSGLVLDSTEQIQLEVQRSIQKHFLSYDVYVPLEDIFFTQRLIQANKDLESMLKKTCGHGSFSLWLPLVVRIPLVGERSSEWCWNIPLKK